MSGEIAYSTREKDGFVSFGYRCNLLPAEIALGRQEYLTVDLDDEKTMTPISLTVENRHGDQAQIKLSIATIRSLAQWILEDIGT